MSRSLAIFGAGGHGRVIAECAEANGWTSIRFFDDGGAGSVASSDWSVEGTGADLLTHASSFDGVVVGIGANAVRLAWMQRLVDAGASLATVVHPSAIVSSRAFIGAGSVVFPGAVINIGARLGKAVIINTAATVDHDGRIGDGAHISPGAHLAGAVTVGRGSWIGIGAAVREGVTIGHQVCVGAGAVVVKSVDDGLTVVGNPARSLKR